MLKTCFVGHYVGSVAGRKETLQTQSDQFLQISVPNISSPLSLATKSSIIPSPFITDTKSPKMETYATADKIVLVIYTKWAEMSSNFVIIDANSDKNALLLYLYIRQNVYEYRIGKICFLPHNICN
jgi:hypothetical protein